MNYQLGPRYVPTRPKHDSCLFLYYFLPFLAPICLSIWFFFFLSWIRLSNGIEILVRHLTDLSTSIYVWLCSVHTVYEVGLQIAPIIIHNLFYQFSNYTTKCVWKWPQMVRFWQNTTFIIVKCLFRSKVSQIV